MAPPVVTTLVQTGGRLLPMLTAQRELQHCYSQLGGALIELSPR